LTNANGSIASNHYHPVMKNIPLVILKKEVCEYDYEYDNDEVMIMMKIIIIMVIIIIIIMTISFLPFYSFAVFSDTTLATSTQLLLFTVRVSL